MKTNDIAFICDDNYCMPTAVCIQSIIDNVIVEESLTIHVCSTSLSEDNVQMLLALVTDKVRIRVDLFDEKLFENKINEISQKTHVTPTALIKFELANYFKELDTILYLDSDIIVKGDINELLKIDLSDYYAAASYEFYCHLNRIRYTLHRSVSNDFYFNSGVMLLNLNKIRQDSIPFQLWEYKFTKAKTKLMDQESLNAVFRSRVKHLSIKWNFNPRFLNEVYINEINKVYSTSYMSLKDIEDDVCIIHYVGKIDKPWVYRNALMRSYWEREYNNSNCNYPLDLKEATDEQRKLSTSIYSNLKNLGLFKTICYLIYLMENKYLKYLKNK